MPKSKTKYRLFASPDHDWFVMAKLVDGKVTVLEEGHSRSQSLEAMIADMGMDVPEAHEVDMSDGSFVPTVNDF